MIPNRFNLPTVEDELNGALYPIPGPGGASRQHSRAFRVRGGGCRSGPAFRAWPESRSQPMFAPGGVSTSPAAVLDSAEVCRRWSDPELLRQSIEDQIDFEASDYLLH